MRLAALVGRDERHKKTRMLHNKTAAPRFLGAKGGVGVGIFRQSHMISLQRSEGGKGGGVTCVTSGLLISPLSR